MNEDRLYHLTIRIEHLEKQIEQIAQLLAEMKIQQQKIQPQRPEWHLEDTSRS